jgi:DNA polymerase
LLVVGDWLAVPEGLQPPTGCVFGIEQDRMLGKMIDAIKLPRTQVFVTNVIKCGIPASCQPKAEHVRACLPFLHRQIALLQPEMILAMGMIATKALLNRREPLSALRGQLHALVIRDDLKIPLIATYHPTFLLQNPEMKQATWLDLQLLGRQLGTII